MEYAIFKASCEMFLSQQKAASKKMRDLAGDQRGPMGLTPDHIKFSPEFRAARQQYQQATASLRRLNGAYARRFAREIRADIEQARMARLASRTRVAPRQDSRHLEERLPPTGR